MRGLISVKYDSAFVGSLSESHVGLAKLRKSLLSERIAYKSLRTARCLAPNCFMWKLSSTWGCGPFAPPAMATADVKDSDRRKMDGNTTNDCQGWQIGRGKTEQNRRKKIRGI